MVAFRDYCYRARASGWDGESVLVYGSALPEREDGVKVQKKREAAFELTSPEDKPYPAVTEEKRELEGWEWARIKKKNKRLKEIQTTLDFK